ncbi:MAG: amidohydrolase family protein [Bacteroidota bacterium]
MRFLLASLALLLTVPTQAQDRPPLDPGVRPVTRTFAITNARVVPEPGRVLERATVVVRNGLIEAVGEDVAVPFDAEVVEGDSLTVYAGFIDGLGHAGIAESEDDEAERPRDPGNPPREAAGLTPDRDARTLLDPDNSLVEALRKLGFTVAHSVPHDGMLAGQGAVVLLAGETPEAMVLRGASSLFAQFDGASGAYPATPMGIMAALRQQFRDAERRQTGAALYADNPAGLDRPTYDPVLSALPPSLGGTQPVFFAVDDVLEGHRALEIADELGLSLVLGGLRESSMLTDKLRAAEVPVFASLDLPERPEADSTAADSLGVSAGEIFLTERRTRSYADVGDEVEALSARRREAIGLYERNALTLREADIPFGFATLGAKPSDVRTSLRRIVEAGLSEDDALAALTTTPAALLGLERSLGTVEAGKMANLVVTDGSYFDEETSIRFVFVDGERFEVETDEGFDADAEVVAAGTWDYRVVTEGQTMEGTMTIADDGGTLSGSVDAEGVGVVPMDDLDLDGNRLSFSVTSDAFGTITFSGLITGDTYAADLTGANIPPLALSATRRPG